MIPYQASRWRRGVPGQRRDAIAEPKAIALEPLRDLHARGADLGVGGPHDRPFDRARHDLAVAVLPRGMVDDLVAKQRPFLHQSKHVDPPKPTFDAHCDTGGGIVQSQLSAAAGLCRRCFGFSPQSGHRRCELSILAGCGLRTTKEGFRMDTQAVVTPNDSVQEGLSFFRRRRPNCWRRHGQLIRKDFEDVVRGALEAVGGTLLFKMQDRRRPGRHHMAAAAVGVGECRQFLVLTLPQDGGQLKVETAARSASPLARIAAPMPD